MLKLGIDLNKNDGIIWARDGHGRQYDKLTDLQATPGTPEALGEVRKEELPKWNSHNEDDEGEE